jgi:hypothetical protein
VKLPVQSQKTCCHTIKTGSRKLLRKHSQQCLPANSGANAFETAFPVLSVI